MKIKTSELAGPALNWAVAYAKGFPPFFGWDAVKEEETTIPYTTDWGLGGPIIEHEQIDVKFCNPAAGWAADGFRCTRFGATPLIAAMRCYVTSKLGDEVDIPDELV